VTDSAPPDYRRLLGLYMRHIVHEESSTYLHYGKPDGVTDEEFSELLSIEAEMFPGEDSRG
jgi:hypothetical protein